jgi:hypothetical protein
METRTTSHKVTFAKPFCLAGLDDIQPAGTYMVSVVEEQLDTLSFMGWRQVAATLQIRRGGATEHVAIDMQDLRGALLRDSDQSTDPPGAPAVAKAVDRRKRELLQYLRHRP